MVAEGAEMALGEHMLMERTDMHLEGAPDHTTEQRFIRKNGGAPGHEHDSMTGGAGEASPLLYIAY